MTERSEAINELAAALVEAQGEFTAVPKDSVNPFFKSRYAALPDVVASASPILKKHGLAISQFPGVDEHGDTLTTWLMHKSGQYICESMRLHLAKNDAQGQGSATTYARRYAYMGVLGLVADEDDDGNRATQAKGSERSNGRTDPPPRHSPSLTPAQRARVRDAIIAAKQPTELVLAAVGASSVETLTTEDARKIRVFLDGLIDRSDVPNGLDEVEA